MAPSVLRCPSFRGEPAQIEDWIADQLAGSMKRNIATAVAVEEFDAALRQQVRLRYDVCFLCIASESDDRRVLKQEQHVADKPILAQID